MKFLQRAHKRILPTMLISASLSAESIDLAGKWQFQLPAKGQAESEVLADPDFDHVLELPGMMTAQGFGEKPSIRTQWTGGGWRYRNMYPEYQKDDNFKFPFFLQPPHYYVGQAYYRRTITIPESWEGDEAVLYLERPHWNTVAYLGNQEMAKGEALGTPQYLALGELPPGEHVLTLSVDNRLAPVNVGTSAHSVSDHTQGNWNGVVGKIELRRKGASHFDNIRIDSENSGKIEVRVTGSTAPETQIHLEVFSKTDPDKPLVTSTHSVVGSGDFTQTLSLQLPGAPALWDEFTPSLYTLTARLMTQGEEAAATEETFGFREVRKQGNTLFINDRPLSLRGALDCAIFPLTGHPPTELAPWQKIMRVCREYGLNHIRFHSWCPPKAAFIAADEAGIYLQPEASNWSHNGFLLGDGYPLDEWSQRETQRMIDEYGNHASFVLFCHGNEPHGENHAKWLQEWVAKWQQKDDRHLYTTGAGWTVMPGSDFNLIPNPRLQGWGQGLKSRINALAPSTDFDFANSVSWYPETPVVAHESGQWCAYPDFAVMEKFTGFFQAKNYEIFQDLATKNGLIDKADEFLAASGQHQARAYKHDIEAALRTDGLAGFQLLGLQDFSGQGTALVGIVDFFWDPKPYFSAEEYRAFCGATVPLARLPKMVYTNDETLTADLELYHFGPKDFPGYKPVWTLKDGDEVVASGTLPARDVPTFDLHKTGRIEVPLSQFKDATKLTLTVGSEGEDFENFWDIFVYPKTLPRIPPALVTSEWEEAKNYLAEGKKVLWLPSPATIADDSEFPLIQGFSPIFWNTTYTTWQPPHTLGLLLDPETPALADFPTDTFSNWQWWEVQQEARPFILRDHPEIDPLVEMIDDWFTARPLALVFEARVGKGHLIASGADLTNKLSERPVARQLRHSLLSYLSSATTLPEAELTAAEVEALLAEAPIAQQLGMTVSASSESPGHLVENLMDGSATTLWHTAYAADNQPGLPHELHLNFPPGIKLEGLRLTQRQDGSPNGQVSDFVLLNEDGEKILESRLERNALNAAVTFDEPLLVEKLTLRIVGSYDGHFGSLAEIEPIPVRANEVLDQ